MHKMTQPLELDEQQQQHTQCHSIVAQLQRAFGPRKMLLEDIGNPNQVGRQQSAKRRQTF